MPEEGVMTVLCSSHFKADCFTNYLAYRLTNAKLELKETAVPTIHASTTTASKRPCPTTYVCEEIEEQTIKRSYMHKREVEEVNNSEIQNCYNNMNNDSKFSK